MARRLEITTAAGAAVYFCIAGSPWQRGTNETTLLRPILPERIRPAAAQPPRSPASNANSTIDHEQSSTTEPSPSLRHAFVGMGDDGDKLTRSIRAAASVLAGTR